MNMIFFGTFLIIAGIILTSVGISSELGNKVTAKKGVRFITVNEGVALKKYTLGDFSFSDGTTGPVCVIGYIEKSLDDSNESKIEIVAAEDKNDKQP